jgi:hypothetical protein
MTAAGVIKSLCNVFTIASRCSMMAGKKVQAEPIAFSLSCDLIFFLASKQIGALM